MLNDCFLSKVEPRKIHPVLYLYQGTVILSDESKRFVLRQNRSYSMNKLTTSNGDAKLMSKYLKKKSSLCNISSCIQNDKMLTTIYIRCISSLMIAFEICEVQFPITNLKSECH